MNTSGLATATFASLSLLFSPMDAGASRADPLVEGFRSPPAEAKPHTHWQWMNGNVTSAGARADLQWMQSVGIGGVQNLEVFLSTPRLVDRPVGYMSPEWRELIRSSVRLADELGLDFGIESGPGWSLSGGPWVAPPQAMKKLVWSETVVPGGKRFSGRLAAPPSTSGLFQNMPLTDFSRKVVAGLPTYYADVAVIAYRLPAGERAFQQAAASATIRSSAGTIDGGRLSDGDLAEAVVLPAAADGESWIEFSFEHPLRVQAVTAVIGDMRNGVSPSDSREASWLVASTDGKTFRRVANLPRAGAPAQTVSFAPITARVFRVVFERQLTNGEQQAVHRIAELVLQTGARVNRFEDKAGFSTRLIQSSDDTQTVSPADAIQRHEVIDLGARMRPDGTLDWTPPDGEWMVLRFGYSLIGHRNRPASPDATGLEVDKLNRKHVRDYLATYLKAYEEALGTEQLGRAGSRSLHIGSWEAGPQNWTDDMLDQFRRRRGYDARPWMPVLAGRVIESARASDRFLWDFRKTIGELLVDSYYNAIADTAHDRGMQLYSESHGNKRTFQADGMLMKGAADIPMGEIWVDRLNFRTYTQEAYDADVRESASVANLYGKSFVAAEAFTSCYIDPASTRVPYGLAPEALKPSADRMLALGVNRFILHTSVHQPLDKLGPGITLGPCGPSFTRKETWASQMGAWIDYLARGSYLMQQGRSVADVAYLYGEDSNVSALFWHSRPPVPEGYNFDFVNAQTLLSGMTVDAGFVVAPSGARYRVLALDSSTARMSLPVLRKIRDLVEAGATVVGPKPVNTPSLVDDDAEFRRLADDLWSSNAAAGQVVSASLAAALEGLEIAPDFTYDKLRDGTEIWFAHRTGDAGEIYFVNSRNDYAQTVEASFRVTGKVPELWRADTGSIAPLAYRIEEGRTVVSFDFAPHDAFFVLFRSPTRATSVTLPSYTNERLTRLEGPWTVAFGAGLGAPAHIRLDELKFWNESSNPGVKYFSGTATYAKDLRVHPAWLVADGRLRLDLGTVKDVATVTVNGHRVGVLWKRPFEVDVTDFLRAGNNRIEIEVTNLWINRLIGDKQPGATKIAYATYDPFKSDSPLRPSGLLGPVTLNRSTVQLPTTRAMR